MAPPYGPSPSPASSMISSSSRTSSSLQGLQALPCRQSKTKSPVIMQSVKSTQVQKPVLQTAEPAMAAAAAVAGAPAPQMAMPVQPKTESGKPPPSYEVSLMQKQQVSRTPVPPSAPNSSNPSPAPVKGGGDVGPNLPPPPPYPSTAVSSRREAAAAAVAAAEQLMVSGTNVPAAAKQAPVVNTAKIVPNKDATKLQQQQQQQQRKYSPLVATTSDSGSRSESPISETQTISASPVSFMSEGTSTAQLTDSGLDMTHHTSPKPERKRFSPEKEETRRGSLVRNCPPQAYKFYMEQRIENVMKEYQMRRDRAMRLEKELATCKNLDAMTCETMRKTLTRKETNYLRMKRAKLNKSHFTKVEKIGEGAFGEVSLVRSVNSIGSKPGGLYAMKTLKKSHVVEKNQVAHVIAEKDILAEADNDWIVKLYYSFQARTYLRNLKLSNRY